MSRRASHAAIALLLAAAPAAALTAATEGLPADYASVLQVLEAKGDYADQVLKVSLPRNDLRVSVKGALVPTALGFGGWVALTKGTQGQDVLMGDLVLTEDEVNPVISALLDHGLEVSALHNHFLWETPRIFYVHVSGHGLAVTLARALRPALDLIRRPAAGTASGGESSAGLTADDTAVIDRMLGHPGERNGPVYKVTVGRPDIDLRVMGARIGPRMGLNTWAAFSGTAADAIVAGDVAMLAAEVTPVLKALRQRGLDVVAIHHHMVGGEPPVYFVHYWGRGPLRDLAAAVRAALAQIAAVPEH